MLACLRHDPVVGGDHQQRHADARRTGDHGVHQPLVAWHVDEPQPTAADIGKPQVDGDAAYFFLRQPISIDSGQCAYQAGLTMVDMTGGANDHAAVRRLRRASQTMPIAATDVAVYRENAFR